MHWFEALFPFVPHHLVILACAAVTIAVLVRFGDLIFACFTLWNFWHGDWGLAVWCLIATFFFGLMKMGWMAAARHQGYRGPVF